MCYSHPGLIYPNGFLCWGRTINVGQLPKFMGKSDGKLHFIKHIPLKLTLLARDQETTKNRDVPFGNGMDISQKLSLKNEG